MKISRLEKFLINRNLLEKFKKNMEISGGRRYIDFIYSYGENTEAIDEAFDWSETPEGVYFWEKISIEWRKCLKNKTL